MFDPLAIHSPRGKVLGEFSFLEHLIASFISVHYFGDTDTLFQEETLEDDCFSFEMKRRLLYKLLKKYHPSLYKAFPKKELERLQKLRNRIIHGVLAARPLADGTSLAIWRHQGKDHLIDEAFKDWNDLIKIVHPAITSLPGLRLTSQPGLNVH